LNKIISFIYNTGRKRFNWLGWLFANYFLLVFVLVVCKSYFLLLNRRSISPDSSWLIYLKSFLVGLRFDFSVAAYFHFILLIAFLLVWLSNLNPVWQKIQMKILHALNLFLAIFYIFFLTADAQFYHEFSQHIGFKETDYLNSPELFSTILADYPLVLPALFISMLTWIYFRYSRRFLMNAARFVPSKSVALGWLPLNFILAVGLLIIAARGGVGLSNLNWGSAIFSSDSFANQLALNGLFSFGKSYDMEKDDDGSQVLKKINLTYDEAVKIIQQEIDSGAVYSSAFNPLQRTTVTAQPQNKKNVVIILLESWMAEYIGALGAKTGVTSCFDSLSSEGLLFTNFYAGGNRSNRGIVSVVTGYPSHYGKSVMKQIGGQNRFFSIPDILKERGYQTSFIYGGDPEFDNMQGFLINNGVDDIIGQNDFSAAEISGKWGVNDEIMFNRAADYLNKTQQPFFSLIFTISNHEPFEVAPQFERFTEKDSPEYKYMNSFYYSDYALGRFFTRIKKLPFYNNTIFVLVADHGKNRFKNRALDPHRYQIPLLILNSGLTPQKLSTTGGQTDILPTLMSILGGSFTHSSWGRNLLDSTKNQPFYICQGDYYGLVKDDTLLTKDLSGNSTLALIDRNNPDSINSINNSQAKERYDKLAAAYFALSYSLLKKGNYGKERTLK